MSTRVRLWLRPEPGADVERLWEEGLAPHLRRLDIDLARDCPRRGGRGIVARVGVVPAPSLLARHRDALDADSRWRDALIAAGVDPGAGRGWDLEPFSAEAVQEESVVRGGTRSGAWLVFDARDGLPSVLINDITRDAGGDLLLATYEGLCRFDGATATMVRDADGLLRWLNWVVVDPHGNVWFTTHGRLLRYDGQRLDWYTQADGAPRAIVCPCVDSEGTVWAVGAGAASRYDGEAFVPLDGALAPELPVRSATADPRGGLLVATGDGIRRIVGTTVESLGPDGEAVHTALRDRRGRLWAGGANGLWLREAGAWQRQSGLDHLGSIARLAEDPEGGVWAASEARGVARCVAPGDDRGPRLHVAGQGLPSSQARGLFWDRRGFLWAGAWGGGLSRHDGARIRTLAAGEELPPCRVETLSEDVDGGIWLGTWGAGVKRITDDGPRDVPELADCGSHIWSSLRDRRGRLWFGTFENGACCWDGAALRRFGVEDGLGHASVWALHEDRRGRMWFATQGGGLTCMDGERVTTYGTAEGLPHDHVWSVVEDDDGGIWCSTFDTGVSRFDGRGFRTYTTADGLAHDQVWCLLKAADGGIWCGTWGGGVSRFDGAGFATYTTRDGLANNSVRTLCQSRDGHLWFGTFGGGVSRFDGRAFQTFSRREGLVHDAVQHIHEAADGRMWIATEDGVTAYRPATDPPAVRLSGIVADQRYEADAEVELSTAQRLVTFEFSGASFSTPRDRLVYAWRLRGHDEAWRTTTRRRAEVRDLAPGRYTFEVSAIDRDLNASAPAAVDLRVETDPGQARLRALQAELSLAPELEQFIGHSRRLRRVLEQIDTVANTDLTVLIQGETGTGKGLAARAIHSLSARADGPLIQVNCGAIPEGLIESELFGHEKGAFTGAVGRRLGRFELADGGTLFLDEIGDLPADSQQVLLQVLQDGEFQRVGGSETIRCDVRVVAATNRDLQQAMRAGHYREDLYFRLSAFVLHLPPLRDRREDLPLLMEHFVEAFARHLNRERPRLSAAADAVLQTYDWPGNVRELEHLARRAVLVCRDGVVRPEDLGLAAATAPASALADPAVALRVPEAASLDSLDEQLAAQERAFLRAALEASNWVVYGDRGAARRLGVHPEKLRRRMQRLGLRRP